MSGEQKGAGAVYWGAFAASLPTGERAPLKGAAGEALGLTLDRLVGRAARGGDHVSAVAVVAQFDPAWAEAIISAHLAAARAGDGAAWGPERPGDLRAWLDSDAKSPGGVPGCPAGELSDWIQDGSRWTPAAPVLRLIDEIRSLRAEVEDLSSRVVLSGRNPYQ